MPKSINIHFQPSLSHRLTQSLCLSCLLGVDVISAPLAKGNHCCIYVCEHNYYYRGCFKQEKMGVMNETHTFHNSSGFPPSLTPHLKNNETLSLERRNPCSTGCCCCCCCRCIFLFFPSLVFLPLSLSIFFFFWTHIFLICRVIYMSSPRSRWAALEWKVPLGRQWRQVEESVWVWCVSVCVCVCLHVCVRERVCDPLATLAQRALCARPRFITPPLFSTLLLHRSLSLLPILPTDTFK